MPTTKRKRPLKRGAKTGSTPTGENQTPNKGGRPPKAFDLALLDELVQLQCTLKEIAACMRMHEETVEVKIKAAHGCTFAEYFRRHRGQGFVSLRRAQLKSALNGNTSMQQWLGKQWLGQTEHGSPVHPADEGEEMLKAAPPQWEVTIKNVPNGTTPQELARLMVEQLDPVKTDPGTDEPT